MKLLTLICLALTATPAMAYNYSDLSSQAQYFQSIYGNPSNSVTITKTEMNKGDTRPKAVLKGVYYFGGIDGKGIKTPLSTGYRNLLCNHGFSRAYSVYNAPVSNASCNDNTLSYSVIGEAREAADGGAKVKELMREIYGVIKANGQKGPIYLHCAYGVHASNAISQMVLKQFCGISDETAFSNWDKVNFAKSLGADGVRKQKAKIAAFQPDPALALTPQERAIVCY